MTSGADVAASASTAAARRRLGGGGDGSRVRRTRIRRNDARRLPGCARPRCRRWSSGGAGSSAAACRLRSRPAARSATPTANFTAPDTPSAQSAAWIAAVTDEIDQQHQPQPAPQHPQRPEQERPEIESVAHEREAVGRRDVFVLARRRLVNRERLSSRSPAPRSRQIISRPACPWSTAPRRPRADRSRRPRATPAPGP